MMQARQRARQHRTAFTAGIVIVLAVLLGAGSCDTALTDRAKQQPDGFQDATNVVVWRNADQVPNLVTFCADGLAWASTLSSNGMTNPNLLRLEEKDNRCAK